VQTQRRKEKSCAEHIFCDVIPHFFLPGISFFFAYFLLTVTLFYKISGSDEALVLNIFRKYYSLFNKRRWLLEWRLIGVQSVKKVQECAIARDVKLSFA
jgi:hypothetical protein